MKWIHLLALAGVLFVVPACAQQTKTEKKVVITKKTVDANGNETVETIEAEGDDADRLLKEMEDMEDIDIDIDTDGEQQFRFHFRGDGDGETFEWNGSEGIPEDMRRLLEERFEGFEGFEGFESFNFGDLGDIDMRAFDFGGMSGGNAVLGVRVENTDAPGAQVIEVSTGSAAAEAGLEVGDVITAINGLEIENASTLIQKMRKYEPKERIEVEVARNGKKKTMKVTLQARSY